MTYELSDFAARLRESMRLDVGGSPVPYLKNQNQPESRINPLLSEDDPFGDLAMELFALQFSNNASYRTWCGALRATPRSVTHWAQIPAVPTAAFKESELSSIPVAERTTVFHSSGTSGQRPSRHFHSAESLAIYEASLLPWFARHVLPDLRAKPFDLRLLIFTPPPAQAPHSSLIHMFDVVRREMDVDNVAFVGRVESESTWTLGFNAACEALRSASDSGNPLVLLGTAFSFVHLVDGLAKHDMRFELPAGSRVVETGGYKGRSRSLPKSELHSLIGELLGIPSSHIVCEYGMSELSSQAYDHAIDTTRNMQRTLRSFQFPPWARVQIISPETGLEVGEGETGLIRVFDLANVFSVLAVQTEDLGISHGDGFELVGRVSLAEPRGCSLLAVNS